jgi:hypothetical protein
MAFRQVLEECQSELLLCVCQVLEECQSELMCVFVRYWRSASLNYCVCLSGTRGVPV